jgi:hypothetical protein
MIGVISKPEQVAAVEEFFELFKTPWEFYEHGRTYDVVLATASQIPEVNARLLIIYRTEIQESDTNWGIRGCKHNKRLRLKYQEISLPIYGELLTLETGGAHPACMTAGGHPAALWISAGNPALIRVGYDLFEEVKVLLSSSQPVENAHIPTLDLHIKVLRDWILGAGIPVLEIPPAPMGHPFLVCLTHDIDFVAIRNHKFDHSMWGFLYRSIVGAVRNWFRRRISLSRLFAIWRAVASLPFVYLGWAKDFWNPFEWYSQIEKNTPATYFLVPFKQRPGDHLSPRQASRRATAYDVTDIPNQAATLIKDGYELGVHGIDAWHSVEKGRDELARLSVVTGKRKIGIRTHWLLRNAETPSVLEKAGYAYDSTAGYNETIGYCNGTAQVFRPLTTKTLLELPLHIQDGALFYSQRLDLSESEAWECCQVIVDNAKRFGGVITTLWHDRSHAPERFWGDFYLRLLQSLRSCGACFSTGMDLVAWFQRRRDVCFDRAEAADGSFRTRLHYDGEEIRPPLKVRVHRPKIAVDDRQFLHCDSTSTFSDLSWDGKTTLELELPINANEGENLPHRTTQSICLVY